jgi:16S rRNA (guanine527-N7)-methyltransferase
MRELFAKAGFELTDSQERDFNTYLQELIKWNRVHNLTAVRDREGIIKRHFIDSLMLVKAFRELGINWRDKSISDVGSGAGFPGVPLKIFLRDIDLYLIEVSAKRCSFLENLKLKLSVDYRVLCEKAQEVDREFDIVVARALGEFEDVAPTLERLSREYVFVMKGKELKESWLEGMGYGALRVKNPYYPEGSFILWKRKNPHQGAGENMNSPSL